MYESIGKLVAGVFGVLTFLATTVVMGLFNGLVLSVLWKWFVVPVFHLPLISVLEAWGLAIFMQFLTLKLDNKGLEKEGVMASLLGNGLMLLLTGLISLGVGWVLLHFMH